MQISTGLRVHIYSGATTHRNRHTVGANFFGALGASEITEMGLGVRHTQ